MLDDANKIVFARNRAIIRIVGERKNVAETGEAVDIGTGLLKLQSECLGFSGSDPHRAADRHAGRQACRSRRVDTRERVDDGRVAVVAEEGFALAQRIRLQLLAVDLAVADIDVDGNWGGEDAFVVADDIVDGGDEPGRQAMTLWS